MAVVDWLEANSRDSIEESAGLDYFAESSVPWENTLAALRKCAPNATRWAECSSSGQDRQTFFD